MKLLFSKIVRDHRHVDETSIIHRYRGVAERVVQ